MYHTCLFCNRDLGRNEVVEHFPVGRRLAFDAAKGRLWVVCARCGRWNLTPLEERWEAIEECERAFRSTRLRVSTGQVGLARLRAGLDLVRIGAPERRELAAWRYGDVFRRRARRAFVASAAGALIMPAVQLLGVAATLPATMAAAGGYLLVSGMIGSRRARRPVARLDDPGGAPVVVRQVHASGAAIVPDDAREGDWAIRVPHDGGTVTLTGDAARRLAPRILARVNVAGAGRSAIARAIDRVEAAGDAQRVLAAAARREAPRRRGPDTFVLLRGPTPPPDALVRMPEPERLAVEMALNDESERRVLDGELALLEAAWREAEEIAAIADSLAIPDEVSERVRRLRGREGPGPGPTHP